MTNASSSSAARARARSFAPLLLAAVFAGCAPHPYGAGGGPGTADAGAETTAAGSAPAPAGLAPPPEEWPAYGRDAGGTRYSPLGQIDRGNVSRLRPAWTFHTGETGPGFRTDEDAALEATPLMVDGTLYVSTPLGRTFALDPVTGEERWRFDPGVDGTIGFGDFTNRGVSQWLDPEADEGDPCRRRILLATLDARLIALDAATGRPCEGFGAGGTVDLREGLRIAPFETAAYEVTSPPAVVNGLVITGSAIADNTRVDPASGEVRAFDARTGALVWSWDPIPQDPEDPAYGSWGGANADIGAANAWSVLVADPARDLVFVPTGSPAPDYYGGGRRGENRYANSVVALRASTGEVRWHFQTVHHDLWDYDNASPPALADAVLDGDTVPVVLQATKSGMLFVLHRETGEPVFGVEERPVPTDGVPGEAPHPTQPFTTVPPPLVPHRYATDELFATGEEDRAACRRAAEGLRADGIFTPPTVGGTLTVPSNIGGAHWGGVAVDPGRTLAVVPVNRVAAIVRLIPAEEFDRRTARDEATRLGEDWEFTEMRPTPWVMARRLFLSPSGVPCTPPPFGALVAVDLRDGSIAWDVPLGTLMGPDGNRAPEGWGSPNLGGPLVTAGGLVFIGATLDRAIRAFDVGTGEELWRADLPAGGRATPMTYRAADGRQYVVIAAGGGGPFGTGDALVAFALPEAPSRAGDRDSTTRAADREAAVEALLRRHHEQRVAHVLGDAGALTGTFADGFVEVSDGRVSSPGREDARDLFSAYFGAVRFLEWEDVRPPRVRLSPDGSWAEVVVEKRVRTVPADTVRTRREDHRAYAWTERWVREDPVWLLASLTSTDRPGAEARSPEADDAAPPLAARVRAHEVLRRAREAVGGEQAVADVATLRFTAACEGPDGPFTTEVTSARDGRVAFRQRFPDEPPFGAGIALSGPWRRDEGPVESLGAVLGTVVTAHELHLLAIGPESRYRAPSARPPEVVDGRRLDVVEFRDGLGAPVRFLYDPETGLPVEFRPVNHTGRGAAVLRTRFDDWRRVGGVRLPFAITITQGEDVYRYRIDDASVEWQPDRAFQPDPGARRSASDRTSRSTTPG